MDLTGLGLTRDERFGKALSRLRRRNAAFIPLLEALALSRGRGIPASGGLWASMADALANGESQQAVTDADRRALLSAAARYVAASRDEDRTVYRLTRDSFAAHFTGGCDLAGSRPLERPLAERHRLILDRLLADAGRDARPGAPLDPYLVAHLSAYAGAAGQAGWQALAEHPAVLDQLDPGAVASDALRTAFGRYPLPAPIAGVLTARDTLRRSAPGDRAGVRQLATAGHAGESRPAPGAPDADWAVRWARLRHQPAHLTLDAHASEVTSMCALPVSDDLCLIASGSHDGTVRLLNPYAGEFRGEPLSVRPAVTAKRDADDDWSPGTAVTALSPFRLPDGRTALAIGTSAGTVQLHAPVTWTPLGKPFTVAASVSALCEFREGTDHVLLTCGGDTGLIDVWNPVTGNRAIRRIPVGEHTGNAISALCEIDDQQGRFLLAVGGDERVVVIDPWTLAIVWQDDRRYHEPMTALTVASPAPGRSLLIWCTSSDRWYEPEGGLGAWDSASGEDQEYGLPGGIGAFATVCAAPRADGQTALVAGGTGPGYRAAPAMLAFGDLDRDWPNHHTDRDPVFRVELADYYDRPTASCAAQLPGRPALIAVGTYRGNISLWDPDAAASVPPAIGHTRRLHPVQLIPRPGDSAVLLSAAEDRSVWLWDSDTGNPVGDHIEPGYTVTAFCALTAGQAGTLVAFSTGSSVVRLYQVQQEGGFALHEWGALPTTHRSVSAVCGVSVAGEGTFFATAGEEGAVQLWDPLTQNTWGEELDAEEEINAMCRVQAGNRDLLAIGTNSKTGALLLWDPETGGTRHLADAPKYVSALCPVPGPDGRTLLAVGSKDGSLMLWDPVTGTPLSPREQQRSSVIWAICAPVTTTGRTLIATAGESYRVRLWHPVTLEHVHDIEIGTTTYGMTAVGSDLMLATHTGVIVLRLNDHLFPSLRA